MPAKLGISEDSLSLACELLQYVVDNSVKMPSNPREDVVELPEFVIGNIKDFLGSEHAAAYFAKLNESQQIEEIAKETNAS